MVRYKIDKNAPVISLYVSLTGPKGKKRIKMAVDTGATYVMIPHHVAHSLGYDPAISRERITLTTASGVEIVPVITVKSVSALGLPVNDVKVACHELPPTSRLDGLLGLSYLRQFSMGIDFGKGVLDLNKNE